MHTTRHLKCRDGGACPRRQLTWIGVTGVAVWCDEACARAERGGGEEELPLRGAAMEPDADPLCTPRSKCLLIKDVGSGSRIKARRPQFIHEAWRTIDEDAPHARFTKARRGEANRRQERGGREGCTTRFDPRAILSVTKEAVVGDVGDAVTRSNALRQKCADPGDRFTAAVEDAVKVNAEEHGEMVDQEWKLLARAERVLVDGNNLVGGWDEVRLRAYESAIHRSLPQNAKLEVFRDGGGRSADDRIIEAVGRPELSRADRIIVVTDDRELRDRARRLGASTITARYFRDRITGNTITPTSTRATGGFGRGGARPTKSCEGEAGKDEGPEERRWQPGRGATKKRGPSARPPRER